MLWLDCQVRKSIRIIIDETAAETAGGVSVRFEEDSGLES